MADRLRFTILGCGSSGGVPRIGGADGAGAWGACDPTNRKNRRRRCSLLVERIAAGAGPDGADAVTRALIDTSPDLRDQLLDAKAPTVDAVLFTHDHADHTHGIDDVRPIALQARKRLPIWADDRTYRIIFERFRYVFETPEGSPYPPILERFPIARDAGGAWIPITVQGPGGPITATPFEVLHGRMPSLGFRVGDVAYLPDVSDMTDEAWAAVEGLDLWILDALRYTPHPTHANVETALEWIAQAQPNRAILTDLHVDLDYATLAGETPDHVVPAYDGLVVERPL